MMAKPRLKQASALLLLTLALITSISCSKIKQPTEAPELRVYWGDKQAIKDFLDSPSAKAERWVVEALGK